MKKVLLAILFINFFNVSSLFSQSFDGFVKDVSDNTGIAGVKIFSKNDTINVLAITDSSGSFNFKYNSQTSIFLQFKHPEYIPMNRLLFVDEKVKRQHLIVEMIPTVVEKEDAIIKGIKANDKTPTSFSNLNKKQIEAKNYGQDFPYLLQNSLSAVIFSDAGAGIGYTGIRIRGVDQTRINVTINGIPVNDAESQGVFWVDLPDFSSTTSSVQVQRGIGTSTNGSAAFGASINVKTDNLSTKPFTRYMGGFGSFGSYRNTFQWGTGLLSNHWNFAGRISYINSDGFIDRANSILQSWHLSGSKTTKRGILKANIFKGHERTYQAWYGVPQPKFKGETNETERYINQLFFTENEASNLRNSNNLTYNPYTYKNQVDDYSQTYFQLFYNHDFSRLLTLNTAAFYTKGKGYYEEYKKDQAMSAYQLDEITIDSTTLTTTDLVRRRWLNNDFVGGYYNLQFIQSQFSITAGGGYQTYFGNHFGQVIWSTYGSNGNPEHEYYRNKARKSEVNQFIKFNKQVERWHIYADFQVRGIQYAFKGPDQFGNLTNRNVHFLFMNPKAGITYDVSNKSNVYLSVAVSNREPVRDDFIYSSPNSAPKPENLVDYEMGYRLKSDRYLFQMNGYFMQYKNQLVLTGQINDVGAYTRVNAKESYRAGVETEMSYTFNKKLQWNGNIALSKNKIKSFTEYVDDWDQWGVQVQNTYTNTNLALSPEVVASSQFRLLFTKDFQLDLINKYVGRQYLDNTGQKSRSLDPFVLQDMALSYQIPPFKSRQQFKALKISALVNNVFNQKYAPNGYTFSGIINGQRNDFNYVYPQAGINYMLRLVVDL